MLSKMTSNTNRSIEIQNDWEAQNLVKLLLYSKKNTEIGISHAKYPATGIQPNAAGIKYTNAARIFTGKPKIDDLEARIFIFVIINLRILSENNDITQALICQPV